MVLLTDMTARNDRNSGAPHSGGKSARRTKRWPLRSQEDGHGTLEDIHQGPQGRVERGAVRKIASAVNEVTSGPASRANDPARDLARNRKLPLARVVWTLRVLAGHDRGRAPRHGRPGRRDAAGALPADEQAARRRDAPHPPGVPGEERERPLYGALLARARTRPHDGLQGDDRDPPRARGRPRGCLREAEPHRRGGQALRPQEDDKVAARPRLGH